MITVWDILSFAVFAVQCPNIKQYCLVSFKTFLISCSLLFEKDHSHVNGLIHEGSNLLGRIGLSGTCDWVERTEG